MLTYLINIKCNLNVKYSVRLRLSVSFSIEGCVLRGGECSGQAWSVDDFPEV